MAARDRPPSRRLLAASGWLTNNDNNDNNDNNRREPSMARDALDPGPNNDYPNVPRKADGSVDRERFPRGERRQWDPVAREWVLIDLTMRDAEGNEIAPPEAA